MLQKNLHLYRDAQRRHEWTDMGRVGTMEGAVVLVVGLGEIGCYYARMAKALGAYVIGVKRRASEKPDYVDELYLTAQLDEVLGRADVVMSVLPGSAATEHFYTAERFRAMKRSCIFVNCGRGNAVAMDVLEQALRGGEIACAAVDVFEIEPLPASSPLWDLDNLLVIPARLRLLPPAGHRGADGGHLREEPGRLSGRRRADERGGLQHRIQEVSDFSRGNGLGLP